MHAPSAVAARLTPLSDRDKLGIRVEGLHEVNKTWIKAMRKLPRGAKSRGLSAPKIVPRLAFEVRSPRERTEHRGGGPNQGSLQGCPRKTRLRC